MAGVRPPARAVAVAVVSCRRSSVISALGWFRWTEMVISTKSCSSPPLLVAGACACGAVFARVLRKA